MLQYSAAQKRTENSEQHVTEIVSLLKKIYNISNTQIGNRWQKLLKIEKDEQFAAGSICILRRDPYFGVSETVSIIPVCTAGITIKGSYAAGE